MAIGVLLGEKRSFMHDSESFFWVPFWICIHYNEPNEMTRIIPRFEKWNYTDTEELAELKMRIVAEQGHFLKTAEENFHIVLPIIDPLGLQIVEGPNDKRRGKEDPKLYSRMKGIH
jgi:hypothetical protein